MTAPCTADPELHFRESIPHDVEKAKRVCADCPAVERCLADALKHAVVGVWGGTTTKERDAIRKARGIKAEPLTFGTGPTNSTAIKRMYRQGRTIAHIAERMNLTYEAVRLVVRADEERRASQGKPARPDPVVPVACPGGCGKTLLPQSLRKHLKGYCTGAAVAS